MIVLQKRLPHVEEGQGLVSWSTLVIAPIFLSLSWVSVFLRVYVRTRMVKHFLVEDWLMVLATSIFTAQVAIEYCMAGVKVNLETDQGLLQLIRLIISQVVVYLCGAAVLKLSLAFFFLRIVRTQWQRRLIYIGLSIYLASALASTGVTIFFCGHPVKSAGDYDSGQCFGNRTLAGMSNMQAALDAGTNWMFAILAIYVVCHTTLSCQERIIVSSLILLAIAGSIAAIARAAYWPELKVMSVSGYRHGLEWSVIEIGSGIVAGNAATLRPLSVSMTERLSLLFQSLGNRNATADLEHGVVWADHIKVEVSIHSLVSENKEMDSHISPMEMFGSLQSKSYQWVVGEKRRLSSASEAGMKSACQPMKKIKEQFKRGLSI